MRHVTLHDFQIVLPRFRIAQTRANEWLAECHSRFESAHVEKDDSSRIERAVLRYCVKELQIASRWAECPDALREDWKDHEVYFIDADRPHGADGFERNLFFSERAQKVFESFYPDSAVLPDHLIHVSCTGYVSPSAAQILVSRKAPSRPVEITHAYHMGCYAAFPAARIAEAMARLDRRVDIVHTEMCSLHLNPLDHSPEQVVVQSLFGDGHVKYSVSAEGGSSPGLKMIVIRESLVPDSLEEMTWIPSSWGMRMSLSRRVPDKIREVMPDALKSLCAQSGHGMDELLARAIFAIHPGGPRIIESVQEALGLREEQILHSKNVLFERGNMSSATLPHIWKEILDQRPEHGLPVVSFAFGPGLTVFGALFEVVAP